jgi:histidine triad (HIT) family protein
MNREANSCVFCGIVKGDLPSFRVYEDEHLLAFLDIEPVNKGHTLVIPKKHYPTILDVNSREMSNLVQVLKHLTQALQKEFGYDAFNIHQNNGKVAGQVVDHLHFHVWPRHSQDKMEIRFPNEGINYSEGEMEVWAQKLSLAINKV